MYAANKHEDVSKGKTTRKQEKIKEDFSCTQKISLGFQSCAANLYRDFSGSEFSQKIIMWGIKILFVGASYRKRFPAMLMPAQTLAGRRWSPT